MGLVMHIICRLPSSTGVTLTGKPVGVACRGWGVVCLDGGVVVRWRRGAVCWGGGVVVCFGRATVCWGKGVVSWGRGVVAGRGRVCKGVTLTGKPEGAVLSDWGAVVSARTVLGALGPETSTSRTGSSVT